MPKATCCREGSTASSNRMSGVSDYLKEYPFDSKVLFTDKVSKANALIRQLNNSAGNPARELNLIRFMLSCLECAENDMLYADLEKNR